ncbi:hypothetical protein GCM10010232_54040 [Streptomyces amakusaensis]|uniref:XRE family transcriptional regulator n=1 Tax=Streptomyces amakusaensis TaxID=67271 RepID=A0ABW0AM59_9ACTN
MSGVAKPGSKAYRTKLRTELTELGLSEHQAAEQMVADLIRECAMRPRTAHRVAREISLEKAAADYNALSRDPRATMTGGRVWEYEQWPQRGSRPSPRVLRLLAAVYGTTWERLVDVDDLRHMPEHDRAAYQSALAGPTAGRGRAGAASDTGDGTEPETAAAFEQSAVDSLALATRVSGTNVDAATIELLNQELVDLTYVVMHHSPHRAFQRALLLRDQVSQLLKGRQRLTHTRDLYVIAAKCCALLAWFAEDLGYHASALDHARAGWICAEQADHNGARRWIRVVQSRTAFWAGDYIESARLAADGRGRLYADGVEPYLILLEARAWAAAGEEPCVRELLSHWQDEPVYLADTRSEDLFFNLTRDRQHYLAGGSLLLLGKNEEASGELEQALTLFGDLRREHRYFGMELLSRIDAARARLRHRELEAVPQLLDPVLNSHPSQRLNMCIVGMHGMRAEISERRFRGNRTARVLAERMRDFCAHWAAAGEQTGTTTA